MIDTTFIYGLSDPTTGECRYLGKTNDPQKRYRVHLLKAKRNRTHRDCWISSLLSKGLKPVMEVIDEVPNSEWKFWETEYIRVWKTIGVRLTNQTEGGEGVSLPGEKNPNFGRAISEEQKDQLRIANLGKKHSLETRQAMSAAHKNRFLNSEASLETRKRISVGQKKRRFREALLRGGY